MKIRYPLRMFLAYIKRLIFKRAFVAIILIVPIVSVLFSLSVSTDEKGLVTCVIACEDSGGGIYESLKETLLQDNSSMYFYEAGSVNDARRDVESGRADCAWIFKADLNSVAELFSGGQQTDKDYFADVVIKSDTMLQQLSREKLYSNLYKYVSYPIYKNFISDDLGELTQQQSQEIDEYYYNLKNNFTPKIVDFEFLEAPDKSVQEPDYLLTPLKGILGVCMLMSSLAALVYSFSDKADGKHSMFSISNRLYLHFLNCLAACILVGVSVLVSRWIIGDIDNVTGELVSVLIYIINLVGFCTLAGLIFNSPRLICVFTPVVIIASLVLCPIFIELLGAFKTAAHALPTYYYLKSTIDNSYYLYSLIYGIVIYLLCFVVNSIKTKE